MHSAHADREFPPLAGHHDAASQPAAGRQGWAAPDDRCHNPRNYPPWAPPHGFNPKMNIYTNLSEKNIYFKILQKKIYILKFQKKITKIINNLYFIICKGRG